MTFPANAAPPFTLSVPAPEVDVDTEPVPSTVNPDFTIKSLVIVVSAIYVAPSVFILPVLFSVLPILCLSLDKR